MRTVRLSLAGTVIFTLLGGLGAAVLAQDAEPAPPARVSIEVLEGRLVGECGGEDPVVCTWTTFDRWSATDTRLSGRATRRVIQYVWEAPAGDVLEAMAVRLVNDAGAWVGTGRYVGSDVDLFSGYTLTGEGGYEGLTAFAAGGTGEDVHDYAYTLNAVIVDGEVPPFPEMPVE